MSRTASYKHPLVDSPLALTPRDIAAWEVEGLFGRLNREAGLCMEAAVADIKERDWWHGRAAGLLDAIMLLDGTWPGLDTGIEHRWGGANARRVRTSSQTD